MYIDRVFVYLLVAILFAMVFLIWRNERKISKLETVVSLLNKHNGNTDAILRSLLNVMDKFFRDMMEATEKNKKKAESGKTK